MQNRIKISLIKTSPSLTLCIAIFIIITNVFAQEPTASTSTYEPLRKVIKMEGWKIPNLNKKKSKSLNPLIVQESSITVEMFDLSKATIDYKFDFYFINKDKNSIKFFTKELNIRNIRVYSVKNRIYAYGFDCIPFTDTIANRSGKNLISRGREYMGALISLFFFDEDGDGKFEARYSGENVPNHIPDWVKEKNSYAK